MFTEARTLYLQRTPSLRLPTAQYHALYGSQQLGSNLTGGRHYGSSAWGISPSLSNDGWRVLPADFQVYPPIWRAGGRLANTLLGINLSSELSWSPHVSSVVSKANSTLGFLRRNLRKCPSKLKETAYLSLVRSTLEYAATIWDAYYVRDIDSLEQVQRRAARFTTGDYHTTSSVTAMLAELDGSGWRTAGRIYG